MYRRWLVMGLLASALVLGTGLLLAAGRLALARPPQAPDAEPSAVAPADLPWHFESVEETRFFGSSAVQERSLAIDAAGHLHLAYAGWTEGYLNYAYFDGAEWSYELVHTCGGDNIALAVEPAAPYTPHISFDCWPNLMHAYRTPAGWVSEVVGAANSYPGYNTIALEPNAPYTPHVVYGDTNYGLLRHAWKDGGGWQVETVDNDGASHTSLAIAATAPYTIHVSYTAYYSPNELRHAWWTPAGGWMTETVGASNVGYPSLALEPVAPHAPHIVYASGAVRHAWKTPAGWSFETVGASGGGYSLAFAPTAPYTLSVSCVGGDFGLQYAWRGPGGWTIEDVPLPGATPHTGSASSLALEPTAPHAPHIAYLDGGAVWCHTPDDILHLYRQGGAWHSEVVEDGRLLGSDLALAVEPDLPHYLHATYERRRALDPAANGLVYAHQEAGGWVSETVVTMGCQQDEDIEGTSLALEPTPPYTPHIAYGYSYDYDDQHRVVHAWLSGTTWLTEVVAIGTWPSLALEPTPPYTPHIAFAPYWGDSVGHAWLSGTTWLTETIAAGRYAVLALEPTAPYTPHVAYYTTSPIRAVRHAWRTAGGWQDQPIDEAGSSELDLAIAATPPYTLHVVYPGWSELKYAWKAGGGWQRETLVAQDLYNNSLALETAPPYTPRVAYCGAGGLHYGRRTAGNWEWAVLDGVKCRGPVLALEPTAPYCPHVGYQSLVGALGGHSLRHAWIPRPVYLYLPLVVRLFP